MFVDKYTLYTDHCLRDFGYCLAAEGSTELTVTDQTLRAICQVLPP